MFFVCGVEFLLVGLQRGPDSGKCTEFGLRVTKRRGVVPATTAVTIKSWVPIRGVARTWVTIDHQLINTNCNYTLKGSVYSLLYEQRLSPL